MSFLSSSHSALASGSQDYDGHRLVRRKSYDEHPHVRRRTVNEPRRCKTCQIKMERVPEKVAIKLQRDIEVDGKDTNKATVSHLRIEKHEVSRR